MTTTSTTPFNFTALSNKALKLRLDRFGKACQRKAAPNGSEPDARAALTEAQRRGITLKSVATLRAYFDALDALAQDQDTPPAPAQGEGDRLVEQLRQQIREVMERDDLEPHRPDTEQTLLEARACLERIAKGGRSDETAEAVFGLLEAALDLQIALEPNGPMRRGCPLAAAPLPTPIDAAIVALVPVLERLEALDDAGLIEALEGGHTPPALMKAKAQVREHLKEIRADVGLSSHPAYDSLRCREGRLKYRIQQLPKGAPAADQQAQAAVAASEAQPAAPAVPTDEEETIAPPHVDAAWQRHQLERFFLALGVRPEEVLARAISRRTGKVFAGGERIYASELDRLNALNRNGYGIYFVVGEGTGYEDDDIEAMPGWCADFDGKHGTVAEHHQRIEDGPQRPTVLLHSGHGGLHAYWISANRIRDLDLWRKDIRRLIAAYGSDPAISNPATLMRIPGFWNWCKPNCDPLGKNEPRVVGLAQLVEVTASLYSREQFIERLPEMAEAEDPTSPDQDEDEDSDLPPRPMEEVEKAMACYPPRIPGEGTYWGDGKAVDENGNPDGDLQNDRNWLWGLIVAIEEATGSDRKAAREKAVELVKQHSPDWPEDHLATTARYRFTGVSSATFWRLCGLHGYDLTRPDLQELRAQRDREIKEKFEERARAAREANGDPEGFGQWVKDKGKKGGQKFVPSKLTGVRWGERKLSLRRRVGCFEQVVEATTKRDRNPLRRLVTLRVARTGLSLKGEIRDSEVDQKLLEHVLERTKKFEPLTAQERLARPIPEIAWLIEGVLPANDLSILGGRPKVGKTRVAVAMAHSLLTDQDFIDMPVRGGPHKVVLITDDQSDADSASMLRQLGIWEHPNLLWSGAFAVTERQVDALMATIRANPGAVVIIDSLRSTTTVKNINENDALMGALIYDLKGEILKAGGSCVLIHHCNKADGLVGQEALSGHSSIAGAANTVLTLHYLPDKEGRPLKTEPQRRLFREPRTGRAFDLVISPVGDSGTYIRSGNFEDYLTRLRKQGDEEKQDSLMYRLVCEDTDGHLLLILREMARLFHSGSAPGAPLIPMAVTTGVFASTVKVKRDLSSTDASVLKRLERHLKKLSDAGLVVLAKAPAASGQGHALATSYGFNPAGVAQLDEINESMGDDD